MTKAETVLRDTLGLKIPGEGHKNYSVKAGAGGGKTTMLSYRISRQILQGIPIDQFIIITYTNAAAAELREKITVCLQTFIRDGISDPLQLAYATEALNSIEIMQISTIHAFLLKILREYAFEAGIVMDVKMLEDDEDKERKRVFFQKWYHDHYKEIEAFGNDWIYVEKSTGKSFDCKRKVLENMFFDIANVREEIIYDTKDHTADIEENAAVYIKKWFPLLQAVRDAIDKFMLKPDGKPRALNKEANIVVTNVNTVELSSHKGSEEALLLTDAIFAIREIVTKNKNIYARCKELFLDIDIAIQDVYGKIIGCEIDWNFKFYHEMAVNSQKAAKVAAYVCKMQKAYQNEIDGETRVLSNDDILYRAEKLLVAHTDILDKIRGRYSKIYVDEFQDTTGLQTRIIKLLSENIGTKFEDYDLHEDKLLVVGDPKQSIYRFTGAEKAVYDEVDTLMTKLPDTVAESVSLDTNYRSNQAVVEWVNQSYRHLMSTDYTDMDTDWIVFEKKALHGVYRYVPDEKLNANGKQVSYNRSADVEAVVSLVKHLVGNDDCFIEKCNRKDDGSFETPELCSIQYSDIMIIFKNTKHMVDYVDRFAIEGIPVNVQGKFKVSKDEILNNFVLLVDYFANYKDKKKRVTAAQIIQGTDATRIDSDSLQLAENQLRDIRRYFKENKMNSAGILQYLLTHEELYVPKEKEIKLERVRSYRMRLHQMVETCLGQNDGDLHDVVELLKAYLDNDVRREIPLESNENAIRLMNAHQSKGLTGKIVIIADRTNDEKCRYSGFKKSGKYYPTVKMQYAKVSEYVPSFGYDMDILKQVYEDEMAEAIRLQYVAATRAAHALIIMPVAYTKATPWFSDKAYEYDSLRDVNQWIKDRKQDTKTYSVSVFDNSVNHPVANLNQLAENVAIADFSKLSAPQLVSITPSRLEPAGVTGYTRDDAGYLKEKRPGANVFGTVMHRVYEMIFMRFDRISSLSANHKEKAIERVINQAILEQTEEMRAVDHPQEFMDYLKPVMMDYLNKVIAPIVAGADAVYPEFSFSFIVKETERTEFIKEFEQYFQSSDEEIAIDSGQIWINGQADLVVKQKDGRIKVYDFKSDAMNGKPLSLFEEALGKKYEGQLALYRYAMRKVFGVPDVDTELIHLYR